MYWIIWCVYLKTLFSSAIFSTVSSDIFLITLLMWSVSFVYFTFDMLHQKRPIKRDFSKKKSYLIFSTRRFARRSSHSEPYIPSKEPYVPSKEPYIPSKEPYIPSKEPCKHTWYFQNGALHGETRPLILSLQLFDFANLWCAWLQQPKTALYPHQKNPLSSS